MSKYQVSVYVQYDDCVTVEAESVEEAKKLAEAEALQNVGVFASVDIRANDDVEEIE